jgi:hypothetical protein
VFERIKKILDIPQPNLPKWQFTVAIISLIVAIISLGCIIYLQVIIIPSLNSQISHQNTIDYLLTQLPIAQNYEQRGQYNEAISIYENCLGKITKKDYREEYAQINMLLGQDYGFLSEEENKIQNLQKSIDSYNLALEIYTFDNYPVENIIVIQSLGNNYRDISEFTNRFGYLEKAIELYKSSEKGLKEIYENKIVPGRVRVLGPDGLVYLTPEEFNSKNYRFRPAYLKTSVYIYNEIDLADVYYDLSKLTKNSSYYNNSKESLDNAYMARISFDVNSPSVSEKTDLDAYALVKIHEGRDSEGFDNQINAYNESLNVISPQTNKKLYAEIQNGIGTSYFLDNPNNITNIEKSIQHYKLALAYTDQNNPFEYAKILKLLGDSYADLGTYKDKKENFEKAKNAYNTYLTIYTSDYPIPFADTNRDIVILYTMLIDVKNNRTEYQIAQDAFDIAKANNMFQNHPNYESFLNYYLSIK